METLYAAADLTGSHLAIALGTAGGILRYVENAPFPAHPSPDAIVNTIGSLVEKLSVQAGRRPAAIGVALPEQMDSTVGGFLEHSLGLPVRTASETRCAALGELRYGHGRDYHTFGLYILDTRVSGAMVAGGQPMPDGDWGHQTVQHAGPVCPCGNTGCLELFAGGNVIAQSAGYPDASSVAAAARRSEPRAVAAFHDAAYYIGIAAANLVVILRPQALLFAGPLAEHADLLLLPVRAAINERVRRLPAQEVAVRRAATAANAVLLGALALQAPFPHPPSVLP